jgi:Tfp pilus assembly protein PilF
MPSYQDDLGLSLCCASQAAADAYRRGVDAYLHAWPGVREGADEAVQHDPAFALAHALRALCAAVYQRRADVGPAIELAQRHAPQASEREQSHVAAIALLVGGKSALAFDAALAHMARWPNDALLASTLLGAFGLFAFSGRADHDAARLAFMRGLRPHYPADHAWMLSHLGWTCIEAGELDEGMAHAERSLALRRANGNIAHIVMHGLFERDDAAAGLAFIEAWLPDYPEDALLWVHLQWHAALTELELGRVDAALVRFTAQVLRRLDVAPPLLGMSDTASMLWRLRLLGREGLPWPVAAAYCERHFPKGGNVFAELHLAMVAAGRGDRAALDACSERLRAIADKGHAAAPVALHWNAALGALMAGDTAAAKDELRACRAESVRLGGSHAQRTVVNLTQAWAEAA